MGNTQTQTVDGVPITSVDGLQAPAGSTTQPLSQDQVEKALQEAYEKGKAEGQTVIKGMIEAVAADVYENVHVQLSEIQRKQAEASRQTAEKVKAKFADLEKPRTLGCVTERLALLRCLDEKKEQQQQQQQQSAILACQEFSKLYMDCAQNLN
eukprot:gene6956-7696_t